MTTIDFACHEDPIDPYSLVEAALVLHPAFQDTLRRLAQCFRAKQRSREAVCVAVVGESRTGKSRALEEFAREHPPFRDAEGLTVPIVQISVPSLPTVSSLAELILEQLGDPIPNKGTETQKTKRARKLLKELNTVILALDEFQHFYDKATQRVQHIVADWLKVLVDKAEIALVVAGLPSCLSVIRQNEQLMGRFLAPVKLSRFDWLVPAERESFIKILGGLQDCLQEFDLPCLASDEMSFRFYCASGGLIGYVTKLLRQAIWNAIDSGTTQITLEDLAQAFRDIDISEGGKNVTASNPFERGFCVALSDDLLAAVRMIGMPKLEAPVSRSRGKRKVPKIGEVLTTC